MNFFASKSERRSRSLQLENLENRELLDAAGLGTLNAPDYNSAYVLGDDAERIAAPVAAAATAAAANGTVKAELEKGNETSQVNVTWDSVSAPKGYVIQVYDSSTEKTKSFTTKETTKTLKLTAGNDYSITVFAKATEKGLSDTKIGDTQHVSTWAVAVAPSLKKPTATELKSLTAGGFLSDQQITFKVANYTTDETHTLYKGEKFTNVDTLKVTVTQGRTEVAADLTLEYKNDKWSVASTADEKIQVTFTNGFITVKGLEKSTSYKVSVLFTDTVDDRDGKATAKKASVASAKTTKTVVRAPENVIVQPAKGNTDGLTVTWDKAKLSDGITDYDGFYNIVVYDSAGKKVAFSGDKKTSGTTATLTLKNPAAGETYTVTVTPIGTKDTAKPVESRGVNGSTAVDANTPIFGKPDFATKSGSVILEVLNKEVLSTESFEVSYSYGGKAATNVVLSKENKFNNGSVTYADGKITIALPKLYYVVEYTVKVGTGSIVFKTAAAEKDPWGKVKNVSFGSYVYSTSTTANTYVYWNMVLDDNSFAATDYVVKVYQAGQDKPIEVIPVRPQDLGSPQFHLELTGLTPDTEYYVTVTAEGNDTHKTGEESAKSSTFRTELPAPKLTLGESTANSVTVNVTGYDGATDLEVIWWNPAEGEDEYSGDSAYFTYSTVLKSWSGGGDATFADGKLTITELYGNSEYEVSLRFSSTDDQTSKSKSFERADIKATTGALAKISVSQTSSTKTSVKFKLNELVDNKTIDGKPIDTITINGEDISAGFTRSGSIWTQEWSDSGNVTFKNGVFEVTGLGMGGEYAITVNAVDSVGGVFFGPAKATLSTVGSPIVITADTAKATASSLTFNVAGYTKPAEGKDYPTFNGDEVQQLAVNVHYYGTRYIAWSEGKWQDSTGYGSFDVTYDGNVVTVSGLSANADYNVSFTFSGPEVSWSSITVKATTAELAPLVVKESTDASKKGEDKLAFTVEGYLKPAEGKTLPTVNGVEVNSFYVYGQSANGYVSFSYDTDAKEWTGYNSGGFLANATFVEGSLVIPSGLTAGTVYALSTVYFNNGNYRVTDAVYAKTSGTAPKGYDDYVQPTLTAKADGAKANELAFTVGGVTAAAKAGDFPTIDGVTVDRFWVYVGDNSYYFAYNADGAEGKKWECAASDIVTFDGTTLTIKGLQEDTVYEVGVSFGVKYDDPAYETVGFSTSWVYARTADVIDIVPSVSGAPTADGALLVVSNFDWGTSKATGVDEVVNRILVTIEDGDGGVSQTSLLRTDEVWSAFGGISVEGTGADTKLKIAGLAPDSDYTVDVQFSVWDTDKSVYTYQFGLQELTFKTAVAVAPVV